MGVSLISTPYSVEQRVPKSVDEGQQPVQCPRQPLSYSPRPLFNFLEKETMLFLFSVGLRIPDSLHRVGWEPDSGIHLFIFRKFPVLKIFKKKKTPQATSLSSHTAFLFHKEKF